MKLYCIFDPKEFTTISYIICLFCYVFVCNFSWMLYHCVKVTSLVMSLERFMRNCINPYITLRLMIFQRKMIFGNVIFICKFKIYIVFPRSIYSEIMIMNIRGETLTYQPMPFFINYPVVFELELFLINSLLRNRLKFEHKIEKY